MQVDGVGPKADEGRRECFKASWSSGSLVRNLLAAPSEGSGLRALIVAFVMHDVKSMMQFPPAS